MHNTLRGCMFHFGAIHDRHCRRHCTKLHGTELTMFGTALHDTARHCTALQDTARNCAALHLGCSARHCTTLLGTTLNNRMRKTMILQPISMVSIEIWILLKFLNSHSIVGCRRAKIPLRQSSLPEFLRKAPGFLRKAPGHAAGSAHALPW